MMTLKTVGLSLGAVAACSAAFSLDSSAHAATLWGETLSFFGSALLETPEAATSRLNFASFADSVSGTAILAEAGSDVFGTADTEFSVADLTLTRNGDSWELTTGPVTNWLTGLGDGSVGFTLESFLLESVSVTVGSATVPLYVAAISGFFTPSGLGGNGALTAQGGLVFSTGSSFSADIKAADVEVVPTPALLPGLLGLGAAALRQRRQQQEAEEA